MSPRCWDCSTRSSRRRNNYAAFAPRIWQLLPSVLINPGWLTFSPCCFSRSYVICCVPLISVSSRHACLVCVRNTASFVPPTSCLHTSCRAQSSYLSYLKNQRRRTGGANTTIYSKWNGTFLHNSTWAQYIGYASIIRVKASLGAEMNKWENNRGRDVNHDRGLEVLLGEVG